MCDCAVRVNEKSQGLWPTLHSWHHCVRAGSKDKGNFSRGNNTRSLGFLTAPPALNDTLNDEALR